MIVNDVDAIMINGTESQGFALSVAPHVSLANTTKLPRTIIIDIPRCRMYTEQWADKQSSP